MRQSRVWWRPNRCLVQRGIMSGTVVMADRAQQVLHSTPYLDETLAFIVLDSERAAFSRWDDVRAHGALRLGVPPAPYYVRKLQAELPAVTIVPFTTIDEMFTHRDPPLDGFVITAERGAAYTLLHPEYSVVVPQPRPIKVPLAYLVAGQDEPLATVVNAWIDLKRKDGTIDELFAHWILGRDAVVGRRRWSVIDDVWPGGCGGVDR